MAQIALAGTGIIANTVKHFFPGLYQRGKDEFTWTVAGFAGFVPSIFALFIPLMIVLTLIFIYVFSFSTPGALFSAYIIQALITMLIVQWFLDKTLQYGFAISDVEK